MKAAVYHRFGLNVNDHFLVRFPKFAHRAAKIAQLLEGHGRCHYCADALF